MLCSCLSSKTLCSCPPQPSSCRRIIRREVNDQFNSRLGGEGTAIANQQCIARTRDRRTGRPKRCQVKRGINPENGLCLWHDPERKGVADRAPSFAKMLKPKITPGRAKP